MQLIPYGQSFLPGTENVSVYDLVFPVLHIAADGTPKALIGSCFAIASCGLYLTAAHLFKPFQEAYRQFKLPGGREMPVAYKEDELRCGIPAYKDKKWVGLSRVDALTICYEHDLALMFVVNDYRGRRGPFLPIIENPCVGMPVKIVGFPGFSNTLAFPTGEEEQADFTLDLALVESDGNIAALHPDKREAPLGWFPCIETSAPMRSGHSGGPALCRQTLGVVGVNSHSPSWEDSSKISWLGKALDVVFDFHDVVFQNEAGRSVPLQNTTLRKLAQQGIIQLG